MNADWLELLTWRPLEEAVAIQALSSSSTGSYGCGCTLAFNTEYAYQGPGTVL
jgi:hypothetical protein